MARSGTGLGLAMLLFAIGCGGGLRTYAVKGKVVYDKGDVKSLARSAVYAQSETRNHQATGDIQEDGTFDLGSRSPEGRPLPGVPEGTYQARILLNTDNGTEDDQFRKTRIDPKFLKNGALSFKVPPDADVILTVTPAKPGTKFTSGCGGADEDAGDDVP